MVQLNGAVQLTRTNPIGIGAHTQKIVRDAPTMDVIRIISNISRANNAKVIWMKIVLDYRKTMVSTKYVMVRKCIRIRAEDAILLKKVSSFRFIIIQLQAKYSTNFVIFFDVEHSVERGCLLDLNSTMIDWCQQNETCTICLDENCNSASFKSSAVVAVASKLFVLMAISHIFLSNLL